MKRLALLFWELFRISLFVIGGGYAIIAVADDAFAKRGWTKEGELVDSLPVFQMVPGLVATHTAVYVGNKIAGAIGAAVGVVAVAIPSVVIFTFVSAGYASLPLDNPWLVSAFVGLRSALTGIIAATVARSARKAANVFGGVVFALSLAALASGVAPVWAVLLAAMGVGIASEFAPKAGGGRRFASPAWLGTLLFLKYGALCFGGGFVLVPMYVEDFVGASAPYLQIPAEEFSNLMALTQMTPGPIGVNGATFFGYRLAGIVGAVAAPLARPIQQEPRRRRASQGGASRVRRADVRRALDFREDERLRRRDARGSACRRACRGLGVRCVPQEAEPRAAHPAVRRRLRPVAACGVTRGGGLRAERRFWYTMRQSCDCLRRLSLPRVLEIRAFGASW